MFQCPLDDEYRFRTQCRITTCKMYNEKTKCNCLSLDTNFAAHDKAISDSELLIYKFPDKTQREVSSIRKRAVSRVQAVVALHTLTTQIRAKERPENGLNTKLMKLLSGEARRLLKKSFRSKLFRIRHLDFEVWMIPFVLDKEYANEVVPDFDRFAIHLLFRWTAKELEIVADSLNEARNHRGQSKILSQNHS